MNVITNLEEKKCRNQGITLIALVITIIILLILAGVSIAMLTGDNGILKKATTANEETTKGAAEEKVKIAVYGSYNTSGKIDKTELKKNLDNVEGIDKTTTDIKSLPATVVVDGYEVTITGKLDVAMAKPGEIVTGANKEYEKNGTAIIPVGFAIVPGLDDVSEGLVISDVANDTENKGNQFVWVPVKDGVGVDGEYTSEEADKVEYKRWCSSVSYGDYTAAKGNYLPDAVEDEKAQIIEYGGFYIGRYESGEGENEIPVSKQDVSVWTSISPINAKVASEKMYSNDNVQSGLMTGTQVDTIFRWFTTSGISINNPITWGNQYGATAPASTVSGFGSYQKTGYSEVWKAKNIYDLAGNYSEITSEYDVNGNYAVRGGVMQYDGSGSVFDRIYRDGNYSVGVQGFRVTLFLK